MTKKKKDQYKLDSRNARIHSERNKEAVEKSLRELGAGRSIVVDRDGVVIGGNAVYEKVVELGLETRVIHSKGDKLIVVVRDDLATDDPRRKALALADNQIATLAEWDETLLEEIKLEIEDIDLDVMGFDLPEEPLEEGDIGELIDRAAELQKKWKVKRGQIWEIPGKAGTHRVMCGDSTDAGDVALLMDGMLGHLVVTDPPYGVAYDGGTTPRDPLAGDKNTALYSPACAVSFRETDEKAALYFFHAGVKGYAAAAAAIAVGYEIRCELVWNKNQAQYGALSAQYKQKHEPFYYCYKCGQAPRWFGPTTEVTVWDCARASVNEHHPTQKPPDLFARAIRNSSERGQIVCDWFLGSGTTVVAAEQEGRICYGIEIEPKYVSVTLERLSALDLKPVMCDD